MRAMHRHRWCAPQLVVVLVLLARDALCDNPLAETYGSLQCTRAREEERSRFRTQWQGIVTAIGGTGHRTHVYASLSERLQAAYIWNPKAAHTSILAMFSAVSRGDMKNIRIEHLGNSPSSSKAVSDAIPNNYTIFTFVREPASAFLSGYAEAAHRMLTWGHTRRARGADTTFGNVDCHTPEGNRTRFSAFLDDVLARRRLGYDTYHIWPQVVKIDALPEPRRFHFVGKMETLNADWSSLLQLLGQKHVPPQAVNPASHQVDQCGQPITVPPEARQAAMPKLCNLLRADYTCLGYPMPSSCHVQDAPGASSSGECSGVASAKLISQRACAQVMELNVGARAFDDTPYPFKVIPPQLIGARFFRPPHRIRPPDALKLEIKGGGAPFSVWVWWNNRTALGRPGLPKGFVPAGEGPRYFREGAVPSKNSPHPGASEMWVYHQISQSLDLVSLTLGVTKDLTAGIAVTSGCKVNQETSNTCDHATTNLESTSPTTNGPAAVADTSRHASLPLDSEMRNALRPTQADATRSGGIVSLQALSLRFQARLSHDGRDALVSTLPVIANTRCGETALVPAGGVMFSEFEAHLQTFGNPLGNHSEWLEAVARSCAACLESKSPLGDAFAGFKHKVFALHKDYVMQLEQAGMSIKGGVVHRVANNRRGVQGAGRCALYTKAVWESYTQWVMGELDVVPRVKATWFDWESLTISSIMEKFTPLVDLSARKDIFERDPVGTSRAGAALVQMIKMLAASMTVILHDIKPKDMLLRGFPHGGESEQWEGRLSDVEFPDWSLFPGVEAECRVHISLQRSICMFACGPYRRLAVAVAFVQQALNELAPRNTSKSLCKVVDDGFGSAHMGRLSTKSLYFNLKPGSVIHMSNAARDSVGTRYHHIPAMLQAIIQANGTCPETMTFEHEL